MEGTSEWFQSSFSEATSSQKHGYIKSRKRAVHETKKDGNRRAKGERRINDFYEYEPSTRDDLSIHPNKISEIEKWLKNGPDRGILFLSGPCGSGKSTATKVLCNAIGLTLHEWHFSEEVCVSDDGLHSQEVSEMDSFSRFLLQRPGRNTILFTEFLPVEFYHQPNLLKELLKRTVRLPTSIIICLSTVPSSWWLTPSRLLQDSVCATLGLSYILTNPVANTYLVKALKKIVSNFNLEVNGKLLKMVADSCDGDLRKAVTNLACFVRDDKNGVIAFNDSYLTLFHLLGRLLYAKRKERNDEFWLDTERRIVNLEMRRPTPERDVNDVIADSPHQPSVILQYLLHHEPSFAPSVSSLTRALDTLSFADSHLAVWQHRSTFEEYSLQIGARSCFFNNYSDTKRLNYKYEFNKPQFLDLDRHIMMQRLDASSNLETRCTKDFFTLIAPMKSGIHGVVNETKYLTRPMSVSWITSKEVWSSSTVDIRKEDMNSTISVDGHEEYVIEDTDESDFE